MFLPGTNRAADRFARASFYVEAVRKLDLGPDQEHIYSGDATASFVEAEPLRFLGLPE